MRVYSELNILQIYKTSNNKGGVYMDKIANRVSWGRVLWQSLAGLCS